jgi:hypothetical protein
MSRSKRKLIWPLPGMATFAIVAALAILVALPVGIAFAFPIDIDGTAIAVSDEDEAEGIELTVTDADSETPPGTPATTITLSWTAPNPLPTYNPEGGEAATTMLVDYYRVDYSKHGMVWQQLVASGENYEHIGMSATHTVGEAEITVYYRVFAVYTAFDSDDVDMDLDPQRTSPPATGMGTTADAPTPDRVENFTATDDQVEEIVLVWDAVAETAGAPITGYLIEMSPDGRNNWRTVTTHMVENPGVTSGTDTEYTHEPLAAGTEQYYRVSAMNKGGEGPPSIEDKGKVVEAEMPPEVRPMSPTGLIAHPLSSSTAMLYWTATDADGMMIEATGYRVQESVDGGDNTWEFLDDTTTPATEYERTDLSAGDVRYYRVWSINAIGLSMESSMKAMATMPYDPAGSQPLAPSIFRAAAYDNLGTNDVDESRTHIRLEWEMPATGDPQVDSYTIQYRMKSQGAWMDLKTIDDVDDDTGTETAVMYIHGAAEDETLVGGTAIQYQLLATNSVGTSGSSRQPSVTTDPQGKPMEPKTLMVQGMGTASIKVSWEKPDEVTGSPVLDYWVERTVANAAGDAPDDSAWETVNANVTDLMVTDSTGLSAGDERYYRVRARTVRGHGPATMPMKGTAGGPAPVTRTAPSNIMMTVSGSTVTIIWTDGAGASAHAVGLVDRSDYSVAHEADVANGTETVTFSDVQPGSYLPGVLATPGFAYLTFGDAETVAGSN